MPRYLVCTRLDCCGGAGDGGSDHRIGVGFAGGRALWLQTWMEQCGLEGTQPHGRGSYRWAAKVATESKSIRQQIESPYARCSCLCCPQRIRNAPAPVDPMLVLEGLSSGG